MPEGRFLTWSPDGKTMLIIAEQGVALFDARTGNKIRDLSDVDTQAKVQFSPDGRWLTAGGRDLARVLDPSTGSIVRDLPNGDILWSSDGASLVITGKAARFYSVKSHFDLLREIELEWLMRVDLDPHAQWAAVVGREPASFGQDGLVVQMQLVDLASGADIALLFLPQDTIRANAAVSPEGNTIVIELLRGNRSRRDELTTSLQLWPVSELIGSR